MQVLDLWNINGAIVGEPHDWTPTSSGRKLLRKLEEYDVDDAKKMFPELVKKTPELLLLEGANVNYKRTRAINLVRSEGVTQLRTNGYFAVEDIQQSVFLVNYPKNSCSCREGPTCLHITAVHVRLHGEKPSRKFEFLANPQPKSLEQVYMKTKISKSGKKGRHLGREDPFYGRDVDVSGDELCDSEDVGLGGTEAANKENSQPSGKDKAKSSQKSKSKEVKVKVPAGRLYEKKLPLSRRKHFGCDEYSEVQPKMKPEILRLEGSDDPDNPVIKSFVLDQHGTSDYMPRYLAEKEALKDIAPEEWPEEPDYRSMKYIGTPVRSETAASDTDSASNLLLQARYSLPFIPKSNVSMLYLRELKDHISIHDFKTLLGYSKREGRGIGTLWLNDNIVTGYLKQLFSACPWVYVCEPGSILLALNGKPSALLVRTFVRRNPLYIVTPLNIGESHWIYLEIHVRTRVVYVADSMGSFRLNRAENGIWWENLKTLMSKVEENLSSDLPDVPLQDEGTPFSLRRSPAMTKEASYWKIQILDCARQNDAHACGVFTCIFATRRLEGEPLTTPLRQASKRVEIFRSLVKNCDLSTYICFKGIPGYPCRVCRRRWDDGAEVLVCTRCQARIHYQCSKVPGTSRSSYVCELLR